MSSPKGERQVALSGMTEQAAHQLAAGIGAQGAFTDLERAVPTFVETKTKSFIAKHTVIQNDLVIQFFLPAHAEQGVKTPEGRKAWMDYWLQTFPPKLDVTARTFFEAESPRIMAKYTEEVASWWFKAQGFGMVTDPAALVAKFLQQLDAALQARS